MTPPAARLLLVEDDPSIRRFVALVLQELEVALLPCASLAEADAALAAPGRPPDALLLDLTLPDGDGLALLRRLHAAGSPLLARTRVFSAGVPAAVSRELRAIGVAAPLPKPIAVEALLLAVQALLAGGTAGTPAAPPAADRSTAAHDGSAAPATDAIGPSAVDVARVVERHFAGDAGLHADFLAGTGPAFAADRAAGDAACAIADAAALRRIGHGLKTVWTLLGDDTAAARAAALERRAAGGDADPDALAAAWTPVAAALDVWASPPPARAPGSASHAPSAATPIRTRRPRAR